MAEKIGIKNFYFIQKFSQVGGTQIWQNEATLGVNALPYKHNFLKHHIAKESFRLVHSNLLVIKVENMRTEYFVLSI
jgi:hypothetical protein